MSLRKILLTGVSLLLVSSSVFADEIPCPALSTVQSASDKLNATIQLGPSIYLVSSSYVAFRESNIPWFVSVNKVDATTTANALRAARALVRNASVKKEETAIKNDHYYNCHYGVGDITVMSGYVK